jgi:hypothetical protein
MRPPKPPLFLGRAGYRSRRLSDAARMLPVLGAFLLLLPILWSPSETAVADTGPDGIYLFLVWAGLIGAAAVLAPRLRGTTVTGDPMAVEPGDGPAEDPGEAG